MVASKPSSVRARRNRTTTRAVLEVVENPVVPDLPAWCDWHDAVREFWRDAWESPMPQEWTHSDRHSVLMAARAMQTAWSDDSSPTARTTAMAEARQLLRECGLTPMSRRSLQWETARAEDASDRREEKRTARAKRSGVPDPRAAFSA